MIDATDLGAVAVGGLVHEDVMRQIWDISKIPLPYSDLQSEDTIGNESPTWTLDALQDPLTDNRKNDGADTNGDDDTNLGTRVGNQAQTSTKTVKVSTRARSSDTIGRGDEYSYQLMMRNQELHRDVEAQQLTSLASVKSNGATTAGQSAGLGAWLTTNTSRGDTATDGGFNVATGIVDAPTLGTARALTETLVRDVAESVWMQGGNPSVLMARPKVIRGLSNYMFTSSARIATLTSETTQSQVASTAKGAVNVFVTDFDVVLMMRANRLQAAEEAGTGTGGADISTAFIIDPAMTRRGILTGYRAEPLAKTGLADTSHILVDYTQKILNEASHGLIADIDEGAAVTA